MDREEFAGASAAARGVAAAVTPSGRDRFAITLLSEYEAAFGKEGCALVRAHRHPNAQQTEALRLALSAMMDGPWHGSIIVGPGEDEGPRFETPQRSWPMADPGGLMPDPAAYAEEQGLVGVHSDDAIRKVGAWRWPLVHALRPALVPALQAARAVDFGGLAGPVGYGALVVDHGAELKALYDVAGKIGLFFSSHTLEHVADPVGLLTLVRDKLEDGGLVFVQVPSWRFERLRAENWPHHESTFHIGDGPAEYTNLLGMLQPWVEPFLAEDDGSNIMVAGRKR